MIVISLRIWMYTAILAVSTGCLHPIEWDEEPEDEEPEKVSTFTPEETIEMSVIGKCMTLLGLDQIKKYDKSEIEKAFRKRSLKVHPDRNKSENAAKNYSYTNNAKGILLKYCDYLDGSCSSKNLKDFIAKSPIDEEE